MVSLSPTVDVRSADVTSTRTDANDVVQAFAANPAFRAATAEELVNEHNPFRRPVRPDDLAWLDFSVPLIPAKALTLSGLLGHRMLRNAYDADMLYAPDQPNSAAVSDGGHFYSAQNRTRGTLAASVLERHLFTMLAGERQPLAGSGIDSIQGHVRARNEELIDAPRHAFGVAQATSDRRNAAIFLLVQLAAILPASHAAIGRHVLGEYDAALPGVQTQILNEYSSWVKRSPRYSRLFTEVGLSAAPVAYWQFFLGSSLGRANYLHFLARQPERFGEFLGALAYKRIDDAASARALMTVLGEGLGSAAEYFDGVTPFASASVDELVTGLVGPLLGAAGERTVESFYAGFEDAHWLARLWDADLARQLEWADQIQLYQEKAEKIDHKIKTDDINVDLDTFVETEEETSTTHVHDEHRLVIIEVGQMHFWNNIGKRIALNQGDKLLIPVSRLHGSVVLSGSCTYHQPIISEELFQQF
jgi:hypothetical protein